MYDNLQHEADSGCLSFLHDVDNKIELFVMVFNISDELYYLACHISDAVPPRCTLDGDHADVDWHCDWNSSGAGIFGENTVLIFTNSHSQLAFRQIFIKKERVEEL